MELDLNISKDGKVIVFHDEDLGRLCGDAFVGLKTSDFNWKDMPKMQREIPNNGLDSPY